MKTKDLLESGELHIMAHLRISPGGWGLKRGEGGTRSERGDGAHVTCVAYTHTRQERAGVARSTHDMGLVGVPRRRRRRWWWW